MIEFYYWPTPNGHKISIMLEECGLEYEVIPVDIGAGDQFDPRFLAFSPNNRIPAIVDTDTGISVFEGGAILIYLAEKTGNDRFLDKAETEKSKHMSRVERFDGGKPDKGEARPGRKMGHMTMVGEDREALVDRLCEVRARLG